MPANTCQCRSQLENTGFEPPEEAGGSYILSDDSQAQLPSALEGHPQHDTFVYTSPLRIGNYCESMLLPFV